MEVKVTTKYNWRDRQGTVETFIPSDDGSIIISRDVPSSADYLGLTVGIHGYEEVQLFYCKWFCTLEGWWFEVTGCFNLYIVYIIMVLPQISSKLYLFLPL